MSLKADWEDRLCPGGCGEVHRDCCDSVVGGDHQSVCWDARLLRAMIEIERRDLEDAQRREIADELYEEFVRMVTP